MNTHPAASPEAIAKRKATCAAKRAAKEQERGYPMPLVMTCNATGKVVRYTVPKYIEKKIAQFGSLEAWRKAYVCREAKPKDTHATQDSNAAEKI